MRPHRRRIMPPGLHRLRSAARPGGLAGHLQPPAKVPGIGSRRLIPRHLDGPQEPEPAQQIHAIRPDSRRRTASSQQVAEIGGDRRHRPARRVDQPIRVCLATGLLQRPGRGNQQPCQVPQFSPLSIMTTDHKPASAGRQPGLARHAREFSQQVAVGRTCTRCRPADRQAAGRAGHRRHGGVLPGRRAGQDPRVRPARAAHRLGGPARAQERVLHAHPGLVRLPGRARRPACATLVGELLAVNALFRLRQAQGVLRLGQRYGDGRLEAACARAIEAGDPSYRTVKGILAAGTGTTASSCRCPGSACPPGCAAPTRSAVSSGDPPAPPAGSPRS